LPQRICSKLQTELSFAQERFDKRPGVVSKWGSIPRQFWNQKLNKRVSNTCQKYEKAAYGFRIAQRQRAESSRSGRRVAQVQLGERLYRTRLGNGASANEDSTNYDAAPISGTVVDETTTGESGSGEDAGQKVMTIINGSNVSKRQCLKDAHSNWTECANAVCEFT